MTPTSELIAKLEAASIDLESLTTDLSRSSGEAVDKAADLLREAAQRLREMEEVPRWFLTTAEHEDGKHYAGIVSMRYLFYKPDGRRQMGAKGRWQRATEYGWENCPRPKWLLAHPPVHPEAES